MATVWRALTDANQLGLWLMNFDNDVGEMTTDFRPVAGTPYRLEAKKGRGWRGYVVGEVQEVEADKRLAYTWAHNAAQDAHPIRITFNLEPAGKGTRLRMLQEGYPDGVKGWFALKMGALGWRKMLEQSIRPVLEGKVPPGP